MSQINRYDLGKIASAATWPITSGDEEDGMAMMQWKQKQPEGRESNSSGKPASLSFCINSRKHNAKLHSDSRVPLLCSGMWQVARHIDRLLDCSMARISRLSERSKDWIS